MKIQINKKTSTNTIKLKKIHTLNLVNNYNIQSKTDKLVKYKSKNNG